MDVILFVKHKVGGTVCYLHMYIIVQFSLLLRINVNQVPALKSEAERMNVRAVSCLTNVKKNQISGDSATSLTKFAPR